MTDRLSSGSGDHLTHLTNRLGAAQQWWVQAQATLHGERSRFLDGETHRAFRSDREPRDRTNLLDDLSVATDIGSALDELLAEIRDGKDVASTGTLGQLIEAFARSGLSSIGPAAGTSLRSFGSHRGSSAVRAAVAAAAISERGPARMTALLLEQLATESGRLVPAARVSMPVLLYSNADDRGEVGSLTLRLWADGPPGLHPDRRMAFSTIDEGAVEGLRSAYLDSGHEAESTCLTWEVSSSDGAPLRRLAGDSLGGAAAVLLRDLTTRTGWLRRTLWRYRPRRVGGHWTITAGVREGNLTRVGHYPPKIAAAADVPRLQVIVAAHETDDAVSIAAGHNMTSRLKREHTVADAFARTRSISPVFVLLVAVACVLIATVATSIALVKINAERAREAADRARQRDLNAAAAQRTKGESARQLEEGNDRVALQLAMASDHLAGLAGEPSSALVDLHLAGRTTLHRVVRAPDGQRFDDAAVAADGDVALVATEAGLVQLLDLSSGDVLWEHAYPPGVVLDDDQILVQAVAVSRDGTWAAYSTNEGLIYLLSRANDGRWGVANSVSPPWATSAPGSGAMGLGDRTIRQLAWDDASDVLVVAGPKGLASYAATGRGLKRLTYCSGTSVTSLDIASGRIALLLNDREIRTSSFDTCRSVGYGSLPKRATPLDIAVGEPDEAPTVMATIGTTTQLLQSGERTVDLTRLEVRSSRMFSTARGIQVMLGLPNGTFRWSRSTEKSETWSSSAGGGSTNGNWTLILRQGELEVHSDHPGAATTFTDVLPQRLAWTADGLLIEARSGFGGAVLVVGELSPNEDAFVARDPVRRWGTAMPNPTPLPNSTGFLVEMDTSPEGSMVAAILRRKDETGQTIRSKNVWDARTGEEFDLPLTGAETVSSIAFESPERVLTGDRGGTVDVFEREGASWTLSERWSVGGAVLDLAVSGNRVLVLHADDRTRISELDIEDGGVAATTELTDEPATSGAVAFLVSGGAAVALDSGSVRRLDDSLAPMGGPVSAPVEMVLNLQEVPGRHELVVLGRGSPVVVDLSNWSVVEGGPWSTVGQYPSVAASPRGQFIATTSPISGHVIVAETNPTAMRTRVCAALGGGLTPHEWDTYVGKRVRFVDACD